MAKKQRGLIGDFKAIIERSEKIGKIAEKDKTVIYCTLWYNINKKIA